MAGTLKSVFNDIGQDVSFNRGLVRRIISYVNGFVTKNDDSINFFGDALIGVYPIRYTNDDKITWFDEVLQIDELALKADVYSLDTIDTNFRVSSDLVNLSIIWCLYRFEESEVSSREKEQVQVALLSMLHYKFLSSLMSHYFRYPADKSVAMMTYASLSKKFSLKVQGSWGALVKDRSGSILAKTGIHYDTYRKFGPDEAVVYMINDIQSRIREVFKAVVEVFHQVREQDAKITTISASVDIDGESIVKDKRNGYTRFRQYLHRIVADRDTFIKQELVDIVAKAIHTMPPDQLISSLEYMSENASDSKDKVIGPLLDKTIIHAFHYLQQNRVDITNLPLVLVKMRAIYMSSRSVQDDLLEIRELAGEIAEDAVTSRNASVKASVRTGILLYLVLRSLTMKHYD